MINVNHFAYAYRQAPWRVQRQWMGAFLLGALALTMLSALYLDIISQKAILGREIQTLQTSTIEVEHANADLQTRLARLLSAEVMQARAEAMGFRPALPGEIHYLVVPGYVASNGVNLTATQADLGEHVLPPEYTQSLLEWVTAYLQTPANGVAGGVSP